MTNNRLKMGVVLFPETSRIQIYIRNLETFIKILVDLQHKHRNYIRYKVHVSEISYRESS